MAFCLRHLRFKTNGIRATIVFEVTPQEKTEKSSQRIFFPFSGFQINAILNRKFASFDKLYAHLNENGECTQPKTHIISSEAFRLSGYKVFSCMNETAQMLQPTCKRICILTKKLEVYFK